MFEIIADDYSLMILNWAIKKTGSRADGEDLAQEVLYQILSFVKDKDEIEKLDNLIWKIAHYTWCNRLRGLKKTGIPKPYLEYDLDWLVDREFLVLENKRYITNFGILDRQHYKDVAEIYINSKNEYYRKIIDYINSHKQDIRNIGFYGCDFDWNKLLWSLLTLYLRYFSETEPLKTLKKPSEHEMHKDGIHDIYSRVIKKIVFGNIRAACRVNQTADFEAC